ncbi:MAG TPA: hypothetical protein VIJ94_14730 [Caulobacteraceae bacterium]
MNKILTGGLAALTIGGVVLGGATEASARGWDHRGNGGAAVAAGIAGLAIGAAIASSDRSYYGAPAPAYDEGPAYYSYRGHCRAEWRWSPRWDRYERVRVCY